MMTLSPVAPWSAVQMWARAIAPCEAPQIQGFPIVRNELADALSAAHVSGTNVLTVRQGRPAEVSAVLLGFHDNAFQEKLGESVSSRFAERLRAEAMRLDGAQQLFPFVNLLGRRRKVVSDLGLRLAPQIPGRNSMEKSFIAESRAKLAANEAVPFAARYLAALSMAVDLSEEEKAAAAARLRREILEEIPPQRAADVVAAAEAYLRLLNLEFY